MFRGETDATWEGSNLDQEHSSGPPASQSCIDHGAPMPTEKDGVASARRRHHSAVHWPYERAYALVGKLLSSDRSCMSGTVQLARASHAKADKLRFLERARRTEAEHAFARAREAKDTQLRDMRSALQTDLRHSCSLVALRCEQWLAPSDARVCLEQLGAIDRRLAAYERAVLELDCVHDKQAEALTADIVKREIILVKTEHDAAMLAAGHFHRLGKHQARVAARVVQAAITWGARARNRVMLRQRAEATASMRAAQREAGVLREQLERLVERQRERAAQERARLRSVEAANRQEEEVELQREEEKDAVLAIELGKWQGLAEAAEREAAAADQRAVAADLRAVELARELELATAEQRRLRAVTESFAAQLDISKSDADQLRRQVEAKKKQAEDQVVDIQGPDLEREREARRVAEHALSNSEKRLAAFVRARDERGGGATSAGSAAGDAGGAGQVSGGRAAAVTTDHAKAHDHVQEALLNERSLRYAAEEMLREVRAQLLQLKASPGEVAPAQLRPAGTPGGESQQPAVQDGPHRRSGADGGGIAAEAIVEREVWRQLGASLSALEQGRPVAPLELRRLKSLYSMAQQQVRAEQQELVQTVTEAARREILATSEAAQVELKQRLSEERARGERESDAMALRLKQGWARQREKQLAELTAWRDEMVGVLSSQRVELRLKSRAVSFLATSLKHALLAMQQPVPPTPGLRPTTPRLVPGSAVRPGSAARPVSARARAVPVAVQQLPPGVDTGAHELVQVMHEARPRTLNDGGGASGGGAALVRFRGRVYRLVAVPEKTTPRWTVDDATVDRLLATAPRAPAPHSFTDMTDLDLSPRPLSVTVVQGGTHLSRDDRIQVRDEDAEEGMAMYLALQH